MISTSFDRKEIMRAAHFTAKWRVLTVGGTYRDWFAKALRHATPRPGGNGTPAR